MRPLLGSVCAVVLMVALTSCGDDEGFSPSVANVAGSYSATTFTLTNSEGTVNLLAVGGEVSVTLAEDGTVTGQLVVPGGGEDGEDIEADLAGTWTLDGSTVTFDQAADTFIRDVEFTTGRDRLTAEGTFEDNTIILVLTKGA